MQLIQTREDIINDSEHLRGRSTISIDDLLNPVNEDDVIETVTTTNLASSIVEKMISEDASREEEQPVLEITVDEKLKILAQARHLIDSAGMMTDPVDRQIGRSQCAIQSENTRRMRQRQILDFFIKKEIKAQYF